MLSEVAKVKVDQPKAVDKLHAQKGDGRSIHPEEGHRHIASSEEAEDGMHSQESHGWAVNHEVTADNEANSRYTREALG